MRWFVSVYFVSFHIVAVIVGMNLLVSIFLDRYLTEWQKAKFEDMSKVEKYKSVGSSASFDSAASVDDEAGEDLFTAAAHNVRDFRTLDDSVLVCHACEGVLHWWINPSVECEITRKVCCRRCCRKCIEPRLDGDVEIEGTSYSTRVGYEPIQIENSLREHVQRLWQERRLLVEGEGEEGSLRLDGAAFFEGNDDYGRQTVEMSAKMSTTVRISTTTTKLVLQRDVDEMIGEEEGGTSAALREEEKRIGFEGDIHGIMDDGGRGGRRKSRLSMAVERDVQEEIRKSTLGQGGAGF